MPAFSVITSFGAQDKITGALNRMGVSSAMFGKKSKKAFGAASAAGGGFGNVLKGILTAGIIQKGFQSLKNGVTSFISEAQKIEDATASFTPLMGGVTQATKLVDALNKTAATTPFQFETISNTAKSLLPAMNGDIKNTVTSFRMLGDAAGGNAQRLQTISSVFTRSILKNKLEIGDLNMLTSAGIPIYTELAKSMGVSVQEMVKMTSQGKVTGKNITDVFKSMTSEGGIFFKGMEIASATLTGKLSTLSDNLALTKAAIGTALLPIIKPMIDKMIKLAGSIKEIVTLNSELITGKVTGFFTAIKNIINILKPAFNGIITIIKTLGTALNLLVKSIFKGFNKEGNTLALIVGFISNTIQIASGIINNFITGITPLIPLIVFLAKVIGVLVLRQLAINLAMSLNPIGLIIIGIVALITAIGWLINNWDLVKQKMLEVWTAFKTFIINVVNKMFQAWDFLKGVIMLIAPPFTLIIELIRSLASNWDNIKKSFKDKGVLGGILAIGKALLSGILAPVESLLNLLSKIPGLGDLAAGAADKIRGIREGLFEQEQAGFQAPNKTTEQSRREQASRFQGTLDISGAPPGAALTSKNQGPSRFNVNLLGVNP